MVPAVIGLLGLIFFGACAARADLDLTPTEGSHMMERMKVKHVVFHDGATEISYQAPKGWSCTGSHSSAVLQIPNYPQAKAYIQCAPHLRVPSPFDDKTAQLFSDHPELLQLPKGAKDVKITGTTLNPLVIDSHPTFEVQVTYSFFGQDCTRSILLVDRKGTEVSCILDCLSPDFKLLEKSFHSSLYSFENL